MSRVVKSEADAEDEDDGGGDLDGEAAEVGEAGDVGHGHDDGGEDDEGDPEVGDEEENDDDDGGEGEAQVARQVSRDHLMDENAGKASECESALGIWSACHTGNAGRVGNSVFNSLT